MRTKPTVDDITSLHEQLIPFLVGDTENIKRILKNWGKQFELTLEHGPHYSAHEVAAMFQISMITLRRWRNSGKIPFIQFNSRNFRFPRESTNRILQHGFNNEKKP